MRSMQISRRDTLFPLPDLDNALSWTDVESWLNKLSELTDGGNVVTEGTAAMHGATCDLAARLDLLYGVSAMQDPHVLQLGAQ